MDRDVYLNTVERLEPEIASVDAGAYYASAAISLKRIADFLDWAKAKFEQIEKEAREEEQRK